MDELWIPRQVTPHQPLSWKLGDTVFHVRNTGSEWHVARQGPREPSSAIAWERWTAGNEELSVKAIPVMPDRPVIVRPEAPIHLAPGHNALFYVSIPLWVRIVAGVHGELQLCDYPCVTLSSIWHGDPTAGQLCYSLRTRARRDNAGSADGKNHLAVCAVTMRNESDQPVEFLRLCLPAPHLNTYHAFENLCTDNIIVSFISADINKVRVSGRPEKSSTAAPAGPARETVASGHLLQRSFKAMRSVFG